MSWVHSSWVHRLHDDGKTAAMTSHIKGLRWHTLHGLLLGFALCTIPDGVAPANVTKAEEFGASIGNSIIKSWCSILPNTTICNSAVPRNYSARGLDPVGAVSELSTALRAQLNDIQRVLRDLYDVAVEVRRRSNRYPNIGNSSEGYGHSFPEQGRHPQLAADEGYTALLDGSWDAVLSRSASIDAIKFGSANGHLRITSRRLRATVGDPRTLSWCGPIEKRYVDRFSPWPITAAAIIVRCNAVRQVRPKRLGDEDRRDHNRPFLCNEWL